jgi:hypothetical protein
MVVDGPSVALEGLGVVLGLYIALNRLVLDLAVSFAEPVAAVRAAISGHP